MFGFGKSQSTVDLTPGEAWDLASRGEILLVDVREANEWAAGHVPGAMLVPLSNFATAAAEIPTDRRVVLYCQMGGRSAKAVGLAKSLGLPIDSHVAGGMSAWRGAGLPVER